MAGGWPNDYEKLLVSGIAQLTPDPLLGIMMLETSEGTIDMAINRSAAEALRDALNEFLDGRARTLDDLDKGE